MKPTYEELEQQVLDQAVQLANAESKCRELAAESFNKSRCLGFFASVIKSGEEWTPVCEHEYSEAFKTPATDAFLAEVRAQSVEMFAAWILRDACGDKESQREVGEVEEAAESFAAQLRKGAAL